MPEIAQPVRYFGFKPNEQQLAQRGAESMALAAIVVGFDAEQRLNLQVFDPTGTGTLFVPSVPHVFQQNDPNAGCWAPAIPPGE